MKEADHPVLVLKVLQWGWSEGEEPARRKWQPTFRLGGAGLLSASA